MAVLRTTQTLVLKNSDPVSHNTKIDPLINRRHQPDPGGRRRADHAEVRLRRRRCRSKSAATFIPGWAASSSSARIRTPRSRTPTANSRSRICRPARNWNSCSGKRSPATSRTPLSKGARPTPGPLQDQAQAGRTNDLGDIKVSASMLQEIVLADSPDRLDMSLRVGPACREELSAMACETRRCDSCSSLILAAAFAVAIALGLRPAGCRPVRGRPQGGAGNSQASWPRVRRKRPAERRAAEPTGTGWGTLARQLQIRRHAAGAGKLLSVDKDTEVCGKGQRHSRITRCWSAPTAASPTSCFTPAPSGFTIRPSRCRPTTSAAPLVVRPEGVHVPDARAWPARSTRSSTSRTATRSATTRRSIRPRGWPFNQNLPAGQRVTYTPTDEAGLARRRSRAASIPGCGPTCCRARTSISPSPKTDGSFEIPNLPAGEEIEVQVWHERAAGPGGALVLVDQGFEVDATRDASK